MDAQHERQVLTDLRDSYIAVFGSIEAATPERILEAVSRDTDDPEIKHMRGLINYLLSTRNQRCDIFFMPRRLQ